MHKETFLLDRFSFRFLFLILLLFSYKINNSHNQPYFDRLSHQKSNVENIINKYTHRNHLKILTWNIYMLPFIGVMNNNSSRAESIGETLLYKDYDIIVFEEAFYSNSRKLIKKELGNIYPYMYGPTNPEKNYFETSSGVWVLSKLPLKLIKSIIYNKSKSFDAIANKGAVMLEGNFNDKLFQLVATHLQADEYNIIREQQMEQLSKELINPFKIKEIPQIICGDFNVNAKDTTEYKIMVNKLNVNNDWHFSVTNISFDEINNKLAATDKPAPKTLDYVFIGNDFIKIKINRALKKFMGNDSDGKKIDLSDHYALEADIVF